MADRAYVKVTDATKGDYFLRTDVDSSQIHTHLGYTVSLDIAALAEQKGKILSASTLKKAGRGVELAVTVKSGTGATATWKTRRFFCPLTRIETAFETLAGKDALGGKIVNCYAPRRADFK